MALINTAAARGEFTNRMVSVIREKSSPTLFFKSFFKTVTEETLELSIDVKRHGRPIAVDILRGTDPEITREDKSTEKIYIPPFYDYAFNLVALDGYDRLFGNEPSVPAGTVARMINKAAEGVANNVDRINRAYELLASEAFLTGILQLKNGDNIDFKRKAASLVAYNAAHDWNITTVFPGDILKQGGDFIRTEGLYDGQMFNVVCGAEALIAFRNNPKIQAEGDIKNFDFMTLATGDPLGVGATPQGIYSYGNYKFRLWGYEGLYDDVTGTTQSYMDPKKIIMLPNNQSFVFGYGGVPIIQGNNQNATPVVRRGEFSFYEAVDHLKAQKFYGARSAGMPILTHVDRVFTAQVVAP